MQTKFKIQNPGEVNATMEITMSINEWASLRKQLSDSWPAWDLSRRINDLLSQAQKVFYSNSEQEVP